MSEPTKHDEICSCWYCQEERIITKLNKEDRAFMRTRLGRLMAERDAAQDLTTKPKNMDWTTDYPPEPGFYWLRNLVYQERVDRDRLIPRLDPPDIYKPNPAIVKLSNREIYFIADEYGVPCEWISAAEWCGPIEPPE